MLVGMMVPGEELREEENENELLEEVQNHPHPLSQTWGLCGKGGVGNGFPYSHFWGQKPRFGAEIPNFVGNNVKYPHFVVMECEDLRSHYEFPPFFCISHVSFRDLPMVRGPWDCIKRKSQKSLSAVK